MTDYLLMAILVAGVSIVVALIFLLRAYRMLRREYSTLVKQLQSHQEDVSGLCAAAVAVDQRLAACDARLDSVLEAAQAFPSPPPRTIPAPAADEQPQGYDRAIQKIRSGAGVEELVRDCGLTRDEAMLLIRLHGGKR